MTHDTPRNASSPGRQPTEVVELLASDLSHTGSTYCPNPKAHMQLWNAHPRVYLDLAHQSEAHCPYCSRVYRLKEGEVFEGGH